MSRRLVAHGRLSGELPAPVGDLSFVHVERQGGRRVDDFARRTVFSLPHGEEFEVAGFGPSGRQEVPGEIARLWDAELAQMCELPRRIGELHGATVQEHESHWSAIAPRGKSLPAGLSVDGHGHPPSERWGFRPDCS